VLTLRSDYAYGSEGMPPVIPSDSNLVFEVELIRWKDQSVKEVEGTDGHVTVRPVTKGEGWKTPSEGDEIFVQYTAQDASGNVFEESDGTSPLIVGEGSGLPKGIIKAIMSQFTVGSSGIIMIDDAAWSGREGDVNYMVGLLKHNRIVDASGDGGIVVKITQESDEYVTAQDAANVRLDIEASVQPTGVVALEKRLMEISVGDAQLPACVETALGQLKEGERAEITVQRQHSTGCGVELTEGETLLYDVHVQQMANVDTLSAAERFTAALLRKEQGNSLLKAGDLAAALMKYEAAFSLMEDLKSTDMAKEEADLLLSLHLNQAMVYKKQAEHALCVVQCDAAIAISPDNTKALFRRGTANLARNCYGEARSDLTRCQELDPELTKEVDKQLAYLEKMEKRQQKKDKNVFAKMMGGLHEKEEAAPHVKVVESAHAGQSSATSTAGLLAGSFNTDFSIMNK